MISKDEAQVRLKAFFNPDHSAQQVARLKKLASNISTPGEILIQAGPSWANLPKEINSRNKVRREIIRSLATLSVRDRKELFAAIFPGVADHVEETWRMFDILPYQSGLMRRPFRDPKGGHFESRIAWLESLVRSIKGYEHQDIIWLAQRAPHLGYTAPNALVVCWINDA